MGEGPIPTEFDSTTGALVRGLQTLGVTEQDVHEDMEFVANIFQVVVKAGDHPVRSSKEVTEVLDCALIGLLYHRRMPFQMQEEDGTIGGLEIPKRADNDYLFTLTAVTGALVRQGVANNTQIMTAATEGALLARVHMPDIELKSVDPLIYELRKQFLTICTIGMIVHRLMPHSQTPPAEQGVYGSD
jgi:hypothetical protein